MKLDLTLVLDAENSLYTHIMHLSNAKNAYGKLLIHYIF